MTQDHENCIVFFNKYKTVLACHGCVALWQWPCKLKWGKAILMIIRISGENYFCFVTFKNVGQKIKNSLTVYYKYVGKWKM